MLGSQTNPAILFTNAGYVISRSYYSKSFKSCENPSQWILFYLEVMSRQASMILDKSCQIFVMFCSIPKQHFQETGKHFLKGFLAKIPCD